MINFTDNDLKLVTNVVINGDSFSGINGAIFTLYKGKNKVLERTEADAELTIDGNEISVLIKNNELGDAGVYHQQIIIIDGSDRRKTLPGLEPITLEKTRA